MKGYKGLDKDFKCRDKQYEVGKTFTEDKAKLCDYGMHFCKYPLDCLNYYSPSNSKYAEVEVDDDKVIEESNVDTQCVTTKLTVKSELNFMELVKASIEYIKERIDNTKKQNYIPSENYDNYLGKRSAATNTDSYSVATNDAPYSTATNTGVYSIAANTDSHSVSTNTGNYSAATNTGMCSVATNTGVCSITTNTGNYSASINTGNRSAATNTGDCSVATNTGDYSAAINTSNCSAATNTGYCSTAITKGKNTAAFAFGPNSIAKGDIDNWIILSEWKEHEGKCTNHVNKYSLKDIKSFKVDGVDILPNTFYKLVDGQPVVVEEDELKKYYC